MKKTNLRLAVVLVGMIAVFMAGSAGKVQAYGSPNADVSGFCSDNNDFGMSHGQCVSIAQANVNALAQRGNTDGVAICKILEQVFGPYPLGTCVSRFAKF